MATLDRPTPDATDTEGGTLPEGWAITSLQNVVSPSREKVEPQAHATARYLSLEHIESNTGKIIGHGRGVDVASTKTVFHAGDVLYGRLRPYLNKVARPQFDGICSTDILVFPLSTYLDNGYLAYFLSRSDVVQYATDNMAGVQLPRISFEQIGRLPLPLPPLAEQRRIAAQIEVILAHVDATRGRLARVPAILKHFRQSVLAAACSGRLTEAWRYTRASGDLPSGASDGLEPLPTGWHWLSVAQLAAREPNAITDGPFGSNLKTEHYTQSGPRVIRLQNIGDGAFIDARAHISEAHYFSLARHHVRAGEVVIAALGDRPPRACLIPSSVGPAIVKADCIRLKPDPAVALPQYVTYTLNCQGTKDQVASMVHGVGRPRLNLGEIKAIQLPIPTLDEQHEIVRRVEALFRLADAIELRVADATARADKLTQAIFARAFRGELVPTEAELARQEGREYEPASVLLERIKREGAPLREWAPQDLREWRQVL